MGNFRKFGTFRTSDGWLTTTGDGDVIQRGTKRGDSVAPSSVSSDQFQVTVEDGNKLRIKTGTVITGLGKMSAPNPPEICNRQFYIDKVFATPFTSVLGSATNYFESPFANSDGHVILPANPVEGESIGIWIARNVHTLGSYGRLTTNQGYPWLIVDSWIGPLEASTRPWGIDGCDMIEWYIIDDLMTNFVAEMQYHFKLANSRQHAQKNYNCQRFRIADVKYESGAWKVYQYWQGTVTLPHPYVFRGMYEVVDAYPWDSLPTWRNTPENTAEQENWEQAMQTYDKGHPWPTDYETIP